MQAILWPIVVWILRTVVLQFLVMAVVMVIVTKLAPVVLSYAANFISAPSLDGVFGSIPPGVWYFLDFFPLDWGLPAIISAYVARFCIRRIPFIG